MTNVFHTHVRVQHDYSPSMSWAQILIGTPEQVADAVKELLQTNHPPSEITLKPVGPWAVKDLTQ